MSIVQEAALIAGKDLQDRDARHASSRNRSSRSG